MFLLLFFLPFRLLEGFTLWKLYKEHNMSHTVYFRNTVLATKTQSYILS